jgi:hypothetical protein
MNRPNRPRRALTYGPTSARLARTKAPLGGRASHRATVLLDELVGPPARQSSLGVVRCVACSSVRPRTVWRRKPRWRARAANSSVRSVSLTYGVVFVIRGLHPTPAPVAERTLLAPPGPGPESLVPRPAALNSRRRSSWPRRGRAGGLLPPLPPSRGGPGRWRS